MSRTLKTSRLTVGQISKKLVKKEKRKDSTRYFWTIRLALVMLGLLNAGCAEDQLFISCDILQIKRGSPLSVVFQPLKRKNCIFFNDKYFCCVHVEQIFSKWNSFHEVCTN